MLAQSRPVDNPTMFGELFRQRLNRARALAPLRLPKIGLTRVRPSARIAIQNFAEFVNHFDSDPLAPARECFACGSRRAVLFPSSTHHCYFKRVGPFNLRVCHGVEYRRTPLKIRCLFIVTTLAQQGEAKLPRLCRVSEKHSRQGGGSRRLR
jgi:hypothetical protein